MEHPPPPPSGFRFLRGDKLNEIDVMKRYQELSPDLFIEESKKKKLTAIIFISHRWEDLNHPDNIGQQLKALKFFFNCLKDIQKEHEQVNMNDSISPFQTHGRFQAALLYSKLLGINNVLEGNKILEPAQPNFLENIGVWYDFMCLPQKQRCVDEVVDDRTEEEIQIFRSCLLHIQDLLNEPITHVLSLRMNGDNYNKRLWCVVEENVINVVGFHQIRLFIDEIGKDVSEKQITDRFGEDISSLISDAKNGLITHFGIKHDQIKPLAKYSILSNFVRKTPSENVFDGLEKLLRPIYLKEDCIIDVYTSIQNILHLVGLSITNANDAIPVVCILMSNQYCVREEEEFAQFYRDLQSRYLSDQTIKVIINSTTKKLSFVEEGKDYKSLVTTFIHSTGETLFRRAL